jgi:dipeptidyl aminopeptidase/acylaminoacyl peptidase
LKRPVVAEDLLQLKFVSDPQMSPDGKKVAYVQTYIDEKTRTYRGELYLVGTDDKRRQRLTSGGSSPTWSPDGKTLAFVTDRSGSRQIWLLREGFGEAEQLTTMRWGAGNPQWSPDGRKIMFMSAVAPEDKPEELTKELSKADREKMSKERADKPYVVDRLHYKMNGVGLLPKRNNQIWVIDVETKEAKQLTSGDYRVGAPVWSPCGEYIAFTSNRLENPENHPNISDLYIMPAAGGELVKLTKSDGAVRGALWSLDGKDLVYLYHQSEYKGATLPKFYRMSRDGGEATCLTPDMELPVGATANTDSRMGGGSMSPIWATNGYIYFAAADHGYANLWRFPAAGGPVEQVSQLKGAIYGFTMDNEGKRVALALSEPLSPGELYCYDLISHESVRLTEANDQFLNSVALSTPEEFNFKSVDDWNVQGWIMKPINFEPGKKYPAVLEIHGGPHTMFGDSFFFEFQLLCSRGYVVIFTNPRGSHGYGQQFVDACRGDYGGKDYEDLMNAMDWVLENVDYVDGDRLGVTGGSYGGFMTNWIVGHTNRFKAAVTQRSISNWFSFTGAADIGATFTENEHNATPWDDPEEMIKRSPLTYVKNVETPLLIIHGEEDLRCPIEQAEQLYVYLKKLGKTTQLLRFPNSTHELSRSGRPSLRIARLNAIVDWMDKYIPQAKED